MSLDFGFYHICMYVHVNYMHTDKTMNTFVYYNTNTLQYSLVVNNIESDRKKKKSKQIFFPFYCNNHNGC